MHQRRAQASAAALDSTLVTGPDGGLLTRGLRGLLLEADQVGVLQEHGVGVQLGRGQAGRDGPTQEVHGGSRTQAQQLSLCPTAAWNTASPVNTRRARLDTAPIIH